MNNHKCIRCKKDYSDSDEDAYLCEECNQTRLLIAREIDAKIGSTVGQVPNSELTQFDAIRTQNGSNFVNIKHLGITL